ncbi:hypothetical protein F5X98DRAFT_368433 [Xylaria grammica]|nr:hypothetical protein F5X98DRAFT_368433 [Xylaria grammica]
MMLKQFITVVLVAILGLVSAQGTTPSVCATGCVTGVFANAAGTGCANGDTLCVCGKTDSFRDGIRDCIAQACAADGPDAQIPLAEAYADSVCAAEPTSTEAAPVTTTTAVDSTTIPVSSAEPSPRSTTTSAAVASTETKSSASGTKATAATSVYVLIDNQVSSQTASSSTSASALASASASTSVSSSSTTSGTSESAAASSASGATTGLSTAVKAGIGAGVGAAALAAIIITVCVCLRRRQRNKTPSRTRNYKISEPMAVSDRDFGSDYGRAEAGLPKPIITTLAARADPAGMATSPTSLYSTNSSDLEAHARRYEDMMPRTQPRTMI